MEFKFIVRRFFAGLLTLPLALAGYFVAYALLVRGVTLWLTSLRFLLRG